jgi:hypothetical protein
MPAAGSIALAPPPILALNVRTGTLSFCGG